MTHVATLELIRKPRGPLDEEEKHLEGIFETRKAALSYWGVHVDQKTYHDFDITEWDVQS